LLNSAELRVRLWTREAASALLAPTQNMYLRYTLPWLLLDSGRITPWDLMQAVPSLLSDLVNFNALTPSFATFYCLRQGASDDLNKGDSVSDGKPALQLLRCLLLQLCNRTEPAVAISRDCRESGTWFLTFTRALARSICLIPELGASAATAALSTASPAGLASSVLNVVLREISVGQHAQHAADHTASTAALSASFAPTAEGRAAQLLEAIRDCCRDDPSMRPWELRARVFVLRVAWGLGTTNSCMKAVAGS